MITKAKEIFCYGRSNPKQVWNDVPVKPTIKGEIVSDVQPTVAGMVAFRENEGLVHFVWPEQIRDVNNG